MSVAYGKTMDLVKRVYALQAALLMAENEQLRAECDELGESCISISRDRDYMVALYEAAMNWFTDGDEWERFEASDKFRAIEAERRSFRA
jgi:hypothetical protein